MSHGLDPAFPEVLVPDGKGGTLDSYSGLTKREYFAAIAIQGSASKMLAASDGVVYARRAVVIADALIAELNK